MKWYIIYCLFAALVFTACEDIYTPEVETLDNVLVADARIVVGEGTNVIKLYESRSFNDDTFQYPSATGATVLLIDNQGNEYNLPEGTAGMFPVHIQLDENREYKIKITYKGDVYESAFEPVPKVPALDTVYGNPENKVIVVSGDNNANDFRKKSGIQLYADMTHEKDLPYYRFYGRKILQYTYTVQIRVMGELQDVTMFGWHSFYPQETFNIAAPPSYSGVTDIIKHPVWFLEEKAVVGSEQSFAGWILILYQYGLSKSAYNYYNDLNNQLESEGRLFDPLYVQARSNINCTSNKSKLVLGNFEISTVKEYRYFVKYSGPKIGYVIKPIPYFYDISQAGEQLIDRPDFWEYESKHYPDE